MSLPIGPIVDAGPAKLPERKPLAGSFVTLEPLDPARHARAIFDAVSDPAHDDLWLYLFDGPYREFAAFEASIEKKAAAADPHFYAIVDNRTGAAVGMASLMRVDAAHRVIEVGGILYTPLLQRTPGATEAMYLMASYVFEELGYRRYEWKCNSLNAPSRAAALRLGFRFEGIFRQHMILKGRNRDTAWFSMLDSEWPERKAAFEQWLAPENFLADGAQIRPLRRSE